MKIISIIATISCLLINGIACYANELSYDDTVKFISTTMAGSTSGARKESYNYIRFNKCTMEYNVLGTYPVGSLYDIRFRDIDFSSLNPLDSKVGRDYTAFIVLNFSNKLRSKADFTEMTMNNLVVNVSTDEKAQLLFKAFLHLGELCGAQKSP